MSNAEDLNRLTACSLVLLGHIFYVLGNHRVSALGQVEGQGASVVLGRAGGHHQAALYILCPSMILSPWIPPSPLSSMRFGKDRLSAWGKELGNWGSLEGGSVGQMDPVLGESAWSRQG